MGIPENIDALLVKYDIKPDTLARIAGVSPPTISRWRHGGGIRDANLQPILDHFHLDRDDILSESAGLAAKEHGRFVAEHGIAPSPSLATAPLLGWVHAGAPEDERVLDAEIELPSRVLDAHPHGFFLRVEGDCMNRRYPEGCHVFVDPDVSPWNGCAVAAELQGYEGVLRAYYRGNSSLMLCADSFSDYEDIILTGEDPVRLIGVVVWFQAEKEEGE